MTNDIFGRRRPHPEKRIDCAAKLVPKQRKPTLAGALKQASKAGAKVRGATVAPDGTVSLQFGEAGAPHGNGANETPEDLRKLI